jgi:hypothetical protein
MITNYYNIPNIPCENRLSIDGKTIEEQNNLLINDKQLRCSGLNPDKVFLTLFPDRADPTINYDIRNSKKIIVGNLIGNESEKDAKECAKDCSAEDKCTYFTIEKGPNECRLYASKEITKNDKFVELAKTNNIQTWRKNDLLDGTKNCNIEDSFISQSIGYFPNVVNENNFLKKNSQQGLTKNECLSSCLYDESCNSVVFLESKTKCAKMESNFDAANNALTNSNSNNQNTSTYLKKDKSSLLTNRFGIKDDMMDYYKTYSSSGKIGDSFCEFIQDEKKCMTSYIVGPNNEKQVPSTNSRTVTKVPAPKLCMPPNCIPKLPDTGLKGKLKVDASFNIMCPPGSGNDAKECVKAIDKTPFVTFDRMGLPTDNDASNPPNGYLPYTMEYDTFNNLEIPTSANSKLMNEGEKPTIGSMEFPEDCQNWCNKSVDCGAYSYYFGDDGKAKCNYYQNVGMNDLKDTLKPKKDMHTLIKRGNRYVQKPLQKEIKKPYFNNSSPADTGVSKEKVCIQEGFTTQDQYCPFPYNKIPASDTDKIIKDDDNGSNCPTPLVKCGDTRYGCCADNETSKMNTVGSNCPILNREQCLGSAFGCCPGTVIPKVYLCDDDTKDICKMTNCELNDNETGDPYAFYGGTGAKCISNSFCMPSGQMCVDGVCKFYNEKYYNGLNGVKMESIHRESGNSMNDLLCGCENQPRNTTCNNNTYDPVCGVDGKTYRSKCVAENSGIKIEHYGACEDILEKFYNLDDFKMPIKKSRTSYWILSLLLIILVASILYLFR